MSPLLSAVDIRVLTSHSAVVSTFRCGRSSRRVSVPVLSATRSERGPCEGMRNSEETLVQIQVPPNLF